MAVAHDTDTMISVLASRVNADDGVRAGRLVVEVKASQQFRDTKASTSAAHQNI